MRFGIETLCFELRCGLAEIQQNLSFRAVESRAYAAYYFHI